MVVGLVDETAQVDDLAFQMTDTLLVFLVLELLVTHTAERLLQVTVDTVAQYRTVTHRLRINPEHLLNLTVDVPLRLPVLFIKRQSLGLNVHTLRFGHLVRSHFTNK
jgi:hypothetical protein